MDQKVSFDLVRLTGLLGFNYEAKDGQTWGRIGAVVDTLACNVQALLKSYQEIQDQNLQLRQQLRSCRCKRSRPRDKSCSGKDQKSKRQLTGNTYSSSMDVAAPESQTYSNANNNFSSYSLSTCGVSGGNCRGSSGTGQGGSNCAANYNSSNTNSNASSSQPIPVRDTLVAEAKQVLLRNGFELLDQIGHGSFGLVYSGRPLDGNMSSTYPEVAIKFSKSSDHTSWARSPVDGRRMPSEVEALRALKAVPSVVDVIGFGEVTLGRDECSIIIMEKPAFCLSFAKYLDRNKPLDESRALFFLRQMASMVLAIHQHGWVHTDLKPANLLICAQDQLKAIDFGLADKLVNGECVVSNGGGTPLWNYPPEKLYGRYDLVKATVWSVGVMYYYMLFGKLPFNSLNSANERPPRLPRAISSKTWTIMQHLLNPDPGSRVEIQNIEKLITEGEKYRGYINHAGYVASEPKCTATKSFTARRFTHTYVK
ncbi:CBL-interacting serine/threonine-protein kinase 7 [Holothuria leucospilota]|uniref:non-specific serine/threonine protein kinase n=1 Tax=Holothuria leucospilota TaxID=206669 RepID=A0A9Q1H0I7_HOLLE|nr:CBL-interacting serine/threonine-protein kinase 7 [Holothuria leucospilota]